MLTDMLMRRPLGRYRRIALTAALCCVSGTSLQAENPSSADSPAPPDAIAEELNFSQAIVDSLRGDKASALERQTIGEDASTAGVYAHAMWLLDEGRIADGATLLERVLEMPDAPADAKKYLAVAYLHLNEPQEAERFVDEYLEQAPADQYGLYLKGVAIARQEDSERANEALKQAGYTEEEAEQIQLVVMQAPAMQAPVDASQRLMTVRQPTSQRFMQDPSEARTLDRPFNFTVLFANEWDSNVPLRPVFTGLGSDFRHEDARFVTAAFADYQLVARDEFNFGLIGSAYDTFQYHLNQFNIQDYMAGAYTNRLFLERWMGSLRYEFHTTLVDDRQFANDHRLTPSLTRLADYGHTTIYGEYNPIDNRAPALIPEQDQSANVYRVGLTQALYTFEGNGRLYAGYQYAEAFAQGTDFDRNSDMVTGRFERPLARGWIADLEARYFWEDYESPNSLDFFGNPREDNRLELRTGVQKNFQRPVSLRLDYTYIDNDSNTENLFGVRFYDYDRHIISTQLIFTVH